MIPIFKPSITRKDMDAVLTCMVEETLGHGEISKNFLKRLSQELEIPACFGLKEYPRALEMLLNVARIKAASSMSPGEEKPEEGNKEIKETREIKALRVALSVLSPAWYVKTIEALGFVPVFLDVDPDNCTIKFPKEMEPKKIADIFLVFHHLGYENDLSWITDSQVPVIEDISQIFASRIKTKGREKKNVYGIFYLNETGFACGLGSVFVYAEDKKDKEELRRCVEELDPCQLVTDTQGAMGSSQFNRLEKFFTRRQELREVFMAALQKSRNKTFTVPEEPEHIAYTFPVVLKSGAKDVLTYAKKKKIGCELAFDDSVLAMTPEKAGGDFPGAKGLTLRCMLFPLYPALSKEDIEITAKVLSSLP